MIYTDFQDKKLSLLGFGTMRLPVLEGGAIDQDTLEEMVAYAMAHGVNYFDTAYPYHGSMSEPAIGRALRKYPRDSWYLATKYPGHQIADSYDPAEVFEEQLKKCGVDYFDFYLLHNVNENSIATYLDPRWGILDYFKEQKRLGRIRHLGFSAHGSAKNIEEFLDACGAGMEFCQIQLNWLDWTLQDAKAKVELLNARQIPIWVMEPVRGGRLCSLDSQAEATLKDMRPDESVAAWGFRFVQEVPGVQMILSGMSNIQQMQDNVRTFEMRKPLTDAQTKVLMDIAEQMKDAIPCTGCRYCTDHCPMGLDIPMLLTIYNEMRFSGSMIIGMRLDALPAEKLPAACISCGACASMCPQKIEIPRHLAAMREAMKTLPNWAEICRERAEAAKRAKG